MLVRVNIFSLCSPESRRWEPVDAMRDLAVARHGHAASVLGSQLIIFGGLKELSYLTQEPTNELIVLDYGMLALAY